MNMLRRRGDCRKWGRGAERGCRGGNEVAGEGVGKIETLANGRLITESGILLDMYVNSDLT